MGKIKDMNSAIITEGYIENELKAIEDNPDFTPEQVEELQSQYITALVSTRESIANTAGFFKSLEFRIDALKEQKRAMMEKFDRAIKSAESLYDYGTGKIRDYMTEHNIPSIECGVFKFGLRKSSAVIIDNEAEIPETYIEHIVSTKISKADIKTAIRAGIDVTGAHIEERQNLELK